MNIRCIKILFNAYLLHIFIFIEVPWCYSWPMFWVWHEDSMKESRRAVVAMNDEKLEIAASFSLSCLYFQTREGL